MKVQLYKNFSKRLNSTKVPSGTYYERDVDLKQKTSIQSPVFILTGFDNEFNYLYVPAWGRYYFIDDVILGNTNLFELHCSCDILATYKTAIGNYNAFVERTSDATKYDVSLFDTAITSGEKIVHSSQASTQLFGAGGVIVCRVLNITFGITTYVGSMANFKDLFTPISDDPSILDTIEGILQYYLCNPGEYVLDCYFLAVPWSKMSGHMNAEPLCSGWYSNGGAYRWTSDLPTISDEITLNKPTPYYSDFRESSNAFSQYSIYIPSVGEVPLSGDLIDTTLSLQWIVDINTGETSFNLYSTASTKTLIATYHGNVKSPLMTGSMMPNGGSLVTSVASGMVGAVAGGPVGIGLATLNVIQNVINPTPSINGSQGSCAGLIMSPDIIISCIAKPSAESPSPVVGKPCCKNLQINTISGYIKCAGSSLDIPGHGTDKSAVNNYLDVGFYYE